MSPAADTGWHGRLVRLPFYLRRTLIVPIPGETEHLEDAPREPTGSGRVAHAATPPNESDYTPLIVDPRNELRSPDVAVDPRVPLTWSVRSATLRTMRPWDRHPPWAHWAFYVIWGIAGTFGPMMLVVALLTRSTTGIWIGIALCLVWGGSLAADWLLVRRLQQRVDGWTPWSPPDWRWLRS
jgi:hypothetical protein